MILKFSKANSKLKKLHDKIKGWNCKQSQIYSFDQLSGWTCPFANECLSKVYDKDGKRTLKDGPNTEFRCFSASQEVLFKHVYNSRKHNMDELKKLDRCEYAAELHNNLPNNSKIIRIHVAGDFFNSDYMLSWAEVAEHNPDKLFYAYTKSLPFWIEHKQYIDRIDNFILTASYGGRFDHLIDQHGLRSAKVIYHPDDTKLEIDHDDSHAADPSKKFDDFALLIHGQQPAGSEASKAISRLKKENVEFSYS